MPDLRFRTLDVFTDRLFAGNPLAVFPQADGIDDVSMARIAREFNLSETVFIKTPKSPNALAELRIFTPSAELPFAGHPTIGASIVLAERISAEAAANGFEIEVKAGRITTRVTRSPGQCAAATLIAPQLPRTQAPGHPELLASALSLEPGEVMGGAFGPAIWSVGTAFTFVAVRDRDTLRRARVNSAVWDHAFAGDPRPMAFIFTMDDWVGGRRVDARMYAPTDGVPEDPATGSASAALTGLLCKAQNITDGDTVWQVSQGEDMGRPSQIRIEASTKGGSVTQVRLGGSAVDVSEGRLLGLGRDH